MSNLKVNTIEPYSGGTVSIPSGSVNTAVNLTDGSKTLNGNLNSSFNAPGPSSQVNLATVNGASIGGTSYSNVWYGVGDYSGFGSNLEDYFTVEYYDSFGYNFGSEFNVNGIQTQLTTIASGSFQQSSVRTTDNGDGTSQVAMKGTHIILDGLQNFADDTAAAAGGIKVNGLYRNGSVVQIRVS